MVLLGDTVSVSTHMMSYVATDGTQLNISKFASGKWNASLTRSDEAYTSGYKHAIANNAPEYFSYTDKPIR